jgi:NCS1 family nucleobase:cation symporter-1
MASYLSIFIKEVTMATQTQRQVSGLYELTDAARAELVDSKYFNDDLAPTSISERTWNTYNISMLWVGMAICIPSFEMAAGLVILGLPVWLSVLNVVLGNVLILIPIQLNSNAGTKYGIPFPVFARMSFGLKGAQLPSLSRAITACGWCAIQSLTAGAPAVLYIVMAFNGHKDLTNDVVAIWIGFFVFLAMTWALTAFGHKVIRVFESIGSPILIIMSILLFIWAIIIAARAGFSFGDVVTNNIANAEALTNNGGFLIVFLGGLTSNIGFWATMALNIPDFSRYAKNQKTQFRGQLYGMPITMAACAIIGAFYAQATALANTKGDGSAMFSPTDAIGAVASDSSILLLVLGIGVIIATLTTNIAANVVAPGNGFSNISPRKISYFWGVTAACVIAIGYAAIFQSGTMVNGMFTFLNVYGGILAPLAAIFIVDYWLVKKQKLDVQALYVVGKESRYFYKGGFNLTAFCAWILGAILPTAYSIAQAINPASAFVENKVFAFINTNAYIFAFVVAFVVYLLLARSGYEARKAILSDEEAAALEA